MSLRVTYPNEGIYANGQPRLEQRNAAGEITYSREATVGEAAIFANTEAMEDLRRELDFVQQQLRDVQTYGLRVSS